VRVSRPDGPKPLVPSFQYDGLLSSKFHMIRQNAPNGASVLVQILMFYKHWSALNGTAVA